MKYIYLILAVIFLTISSSYSQWTTLSSFPNEYAKDIIISGNTVIVATQGTGIYLTTDGTNTWQPIINGLSNSQALTVYQILSLGGNIYAATEDGIYKSSNNGTNWIKKSTGIIVGGGAIYAFTASIFENNGVLYTGAYTGIYRSTDFAESWNVTNASGSAVMPQFFLNYNGVLFAARETNNQPYGYVSTDNGASWGDLNSTNAPIITFFSDGGNLWAGTIFGVMLSTNSGSTWMTRNNGLSLDPYSSSIIKINSTLITSLKFGGSGVYRTANNGMNWENIGQGLPFIESIEKLIVYNNKILAATTDGIWQRNISEIITSVSPQSTGIANEFKLYQNYPNPFNPSTFINFNIPKSSDVKLTIYNVKGDEIALLVKGELKAGTYKVNWDGSNCATGIYFYKLETPAFSETKRMILLK